MNLQPKREQYRKATAVLAPVIDLKSKAINRDLDREDDATHNNPLSTSNVSGIGVGGEFDWNVVNEYDPIWPNEYEKVVKELRDMRDREHDQETEMRKRRRDNTRFEENQVIHNDTVEYSHSFIHFMRQVLPNNYYIIVWNNYRLWN